MTMLIYSAVAIGFLILLLCLRGKDRSQDSDGRMQPLNSASSGGSWRWLDLSARIFDPSDARWVEEELAFPKLAKALVKARKGLAIRWLEALRSSFDEVVRSQETTLSGAPEDDSPGGWQILLLILRFKLLVSYALFIVKVFGPYHRLIPSFSWVPIPQGGERTFRRPSLAAHRISN